MIKNVLDVIGLALQHHSDANSMKMELLQPKIDLTAWVKETLNNALNSKDSYHAMRRSEIDKKEIELEKLFSEEVNEKYHEIRTMLSEYWSAVFDMDELLAVYRDGEPDEYEEITQAIEIEGAYNIHQELLDQLFVIPATRHDGMNQEVYDYRQIEAVINEKRQQTEAGIKALYEDMRSEIDFVG